MNVPTPDQPPAAAGGGTPAGGPAGLATEGRRDDAGAAVEPPRVPALRRWLGRLVSLVTTLAVVGIAGLALAVTAVPAAVGGHVLTVLSGSMVPEFSPGAMVVDKPASASSLRVGDVITYATTDEASGAPILITHRIVGIQPGADGPTFTTQGDANNTADDRPVGASQVRGKVWYSVPYIGTARNFLLAKGAGLILAGAAGLVAAVWFLVHLMRSEPTPAPDSPGSAPRASRQGRHRARNSAVGTALAGLLMTGIHLATQAPGTLAQFSDQRSVSFEITIGSAEAGQ